MAFPRFSLPPELFGTLFPFHLAFDRNMEIVQVGTVLERICLGLSVGSRLGRHFQITRPNIQVEFDAIREHSRSVFILESRYSALQLKGQMVYVEQPEVMLFLCFATYAVSQSFHLLLQVSGCLFRVGAFSVRQLIE